MNFFVPLPHVVTLIKSLLSTLDYYLLRMRVDGQIWLSRGCQGQSLTLTSTCYWLPVFLSVIYSTFFVIDSHVHKHRSLWDCGLLSLFVSQYLL